MFRFAVIKCKDCHSEIDLVPFIDNRFGYALGFHCRICRSFWIVKLDPLSISLSDFFEEAESDLLFD